MATRLHDLLTLPEHIHQGAYVVRLTEADDRRQELFRTYAFTPNLVDAFDRALSQVRTTLHDGMNTGTYLDGSFGAGKSHFLAIFSLLLENPTESPLRDGGAPFNPWSAKELHPLREKHAWVAETKLFRLHLNMMGDGTLPEKLFRGYVDAMAKAHPEAGTPPLFADEKLFDNAEQLRERLGDEAFFAPMQATVKGGFGKTSTIPWTKDRFDECRESRDSSTRQKLLQALLQSHFPAFATRDEFVPFERGLVALSEHAKGCGYQGIVLFLDELVLWLTSIAANRERLSAEVGRLAKLVELGNVDLAVPIAIFAARQRLLSDLVGEQYTGTEVLAVRDQLKFWDGRFTSISLPDTNLPSIVEKRIVAPKDDAARALLDEAFTTARKKLNEQAFTTLAGAGEEGADEIDFRRVYPFSPALVRVLVAMSQMLQRERTAIRMLAEMLLGHMNDFELGKIVPVGDLYDALADGTEPMDGLPREAFRQAKRVYRDRLLPLIREQHGTNSAERCQRLQADPKPGGCANCLEKSCRNDQRLAKTLVLAAIVPGQSDLKELTVQRLVRLNHGILSAPIPGTDAKQALARLKVWANELSEVRVEEGENPRVAVVLDAVDLTPFLEQGAQADNRGARKARLRDMLVEAMGLATNGDEISHKIVWRNTDRSGSVIFGNVREMDTERFVPPSGDDFRVIIDYPFDEPGHGPHEDEARLSELRRTGLADVATFVWLPNFLSDSMQRDLGLLCRLDYLSEATTWGQVAGRFSPDTQSRAKEQVANLRAAKQESLNKALQIAYGLFDDKIGNVLDGGERVENCHLLLSGARQGALLSTDLRAGLGDAIHRVLDTRYPHHPKFPVKVTKGKLKKELDALRSVVNAEGHLAVSSADDAYAIADRLELVRVRDGQVAIVKETVDRIEQQLRAKNLTTPTLGDLERLLDPEGTRGLGVLVRDFFVLSFALIANRIPQKSARPLAVELDLGALTADISFAVPDLPDRGAWAKAMAAGEGIFGVTGPKAYRDENIRRFAREVSEKSIAFRKARGAEIFALLQSIGDPSLFGERARTANEAKHLLDSLDQKSGKLLIEALADFEIAREARSDNLSTQILACHFNHATSVASELEGATKDIFGVLATLGTPDAEAILARRADALRADEWTCKLATTMKQLRDEAMRLVKQNVRKDSVHEPAPPVVAPPPRPTTGLVQDAVLPTADPGAPRSVSSGRAPNDGKTEVFSWIVEGGDEASIDTVLEQLRDALVGARGALTIRVENHE